MTRASPTSNIRSPVGPAQKKSGPIESRIAAVPREASRQEPSTRITPTTMSARGGAVVSQLPRPSACAGPSGIGDGIGRGVDTESSRVAASARRGGEMARRCGAPVSDWDISGASARSAARSSAIVRRGCNSAVALDDSMGCRASSSEVAEPVSRRAPHSSQKRASTSLTVPHAGHVTPGCFTRLPSFTCRTRPAVLPSSQSTGGRRNVKPTGRL
jgi:hypothetical protein